jgi:hypothetical protein
VIMTALERTHSLIDGRNFIQMSSWLIYLDDLPQRNRVPLKSFHSIMMTHDLVIFQTKTQ